MAARRSFGQIKAESRQPALFAPSVLPCYPLAMQIRILHDSVTNELSSGITTEIPTSELEDGGLSLSASVEEPPLPPQPEAVDGIPMWNEEAERFQYLFEGFLCNLLPSTNIGNLTMALENLLSWEQEQWDGTGHNFISYDPAEISNTITGVVSHGDIIFSPVLIFVHTKHGEKLIYQVFAVSGSQMFEDPVQFEFIFIDHLSRKYKDWVDFLENNQLPEGKFCYPNEGLYTLPLQIHVRKKLNKCSKMYLIISGLGVVSTMLTLLKILKIFPLWPPLTFVCYTIDAIVAFYFLYRGLEEINDRLNNGQDINFKHEGARESWLFLVVSILKFFASAGSLSTCTIAAIGGKVSVFGERLVQGIEVCYNVVKGIIVADRIIPKELISSIFSFIKKLFLRCKRVFSFVCKGANSLLKMKKKN